MSPSGDAPAEQSVAAADTGRSGALQSEIGRVTAVTPIIFEPGETAITELHVRILNSVVTILQAYPGVPVTIVGYTDDVGTDEANRQVSLARANSVKDYLVSQGIADGVLSVERPGGGDLDRLGWPGQPRAPRGVRGTSSRQPDGERRNAPCRRDRPERQATTSPSPRAWSTRSTSWRASAATSTSTVVDNTFVPEDAAAIIRGLGERRLRPRRRPRLTVRPRGEGRPPTEFPETTFAWGTASDTFGLSNVYAYDAAAEEGGYVQGALAALLSTSNVIGVVGPIEVRRRAALHHRLR